MSNLLFVCSRNQWRSPTAEKLYREKGYNTRSAGTSPKAKHSISAKDLQWADFIFVMEKKHKNRIVANFRGIIEYKAVHILDVPDDYKFMDPLLVDHLEDVMQPYLDTLKKAKNNGYRL